MVITFTVTVQEGKENDVPATFPDRVVTLISTAFAELIDEGIIDVGVDTLTKGR